MSATNECLACCDEEVSQLVALSCFAHSLCIGCLRFAVRLATEDENHYPIRCAKTCDPVSDDLVISTLTNHSIEDNELLRSFEEKQKEYSIPAGFRMYCAGSACHSTLGASQFINPEISGDDTRVICPAYDCITCRACRELIQGDEEHGCDPSKVDTVVNDFVNTLPEQDKWRWRKCWSCGIWVNKSEACNHMTCRCTAEFCLICGKKWESGQPGCPHGCPHFDDPVYDDEGYNQQGFHRDTGLDREGNPYDPTFDRYNGNEDDDHDNDDQFQEAPVYGEDGFDQWGRDREGFDENGFDQMGIDREGRDYEGYSRDGYDDEGFDRQGLDREGRDYNGYYGDGYDDDGFDCDGFDRTHRDGEGYFDDGRDMHGFDRNGVSLRNVPRALYDAEGYDPLGFDVFGFTRAGLDSEDRDPDGYDIDGFDRHGFGRNGYDAEGYNRYGFDCRSRDREGYSCHGYDAHHRDRQGNLEPGYCIGADGNVQIFVDEEGPSAEILRYDHRTDFVRYSARCFACRWRGGIFHRRCGLCDAALCRGCDSGGVERQRSFVGMRYLWPNDETYGIEKLFEADTKDGCAETL